MGRAAQVRREIEFVCAREADYHVMVDLLAAGKLPLRVTHNDTKLNNILLDKRRGRAFASSTLTPSCRALPPMTSAIPSASVPTIAPRMKLTSRK